MMGTLSASATRSPDARQQRLYFFPLPHRQGLFRPTFIQDIKNLRRVAPEEMGRPRVIEAEADARSDMKLRDLAQPDS